MNDKQTSESGELDELIQHEKKLGLEFFRSRDFRSRLEGRMVAANAARGSRPPSKRWLVPTLAVAGVLAIAVSFLLHKRYPGPMTENIFQTALKSSPYWQGRMGGEVPAHPTSGVKSSPSYLLFLGGLQAMTKAQATERVPAIKPALPYLDNRIPALGLREKLEILLKERPIYRFFDLYFQKKEVSRCPEKSLSVCC